MRLAIIREQDCVGCAKCLPACPVDAIIGAPKFLHTVLPDECIGCGLCIAPCPMDCIEMIEVSSESVEQRKSRASKAKARYQAQQKRRILEKPLQLTFDTKNPKVKSKIQQDIAEAFIRVTKKRELASQNMSHNMSQNDGKPK